jgi:hypothetical protein
VQVHEKPRDLDNERTKLTGNAAYWAKRFPRTVARNADAFRAEQAETDKKAEENLLRMVAKKKPVVTKSVSPEKEQEREKVRLQVESLRLDVQQIIGSDKKKTLREIVMVTAYVLDVLPSQIMSRNRKHRIVLAKAIVSVIASGMGYSASEIGRQMGYSDHTTVLHHIKNLSKQEEVKFWVRKIARMVRLDMEGQL